MIALSHVDVMELMDLISFALTTFVVYAPKIMNIDIDMALSPVFYL